MKSKKPYKYPYSLLLKCCRCGRLFPRPPWLVARQRGTAKKVWCSIECRDAKTKLTCPQCNIVFYRKPTYIKAKLKRNPDCKFFCSQQCNDNWRSIHCSGENSPGWRGGKTFSYVGSGWKRARKEARARDKDTCRYCGKEWLGGRRFDVHHIEPYEDFKSKWDANQLDNLATVCRACHAKFNPYYKGERPELM